eukprot:194384_1
MIRQLTIQQHLIQQHMIRQHLIQRHAQPNYFERIFRLILEGDFNELFAFCRNNNININDFAINVIEFLMDLPHNTFLSKLIIKIIYVYSGSVIIEYSLTSNDLDLIHLG